MNTVQKIAADFHAASSADRWVEELAEQSDLLAGDPETWPAFLDGERWTIGPAEKGLENSPNPSGQPNDDDDDEQFPALEPDMLTEPDDEFPAYEPSPEDAAWLAPLSIADELDDLHATSVWLERLEQMHHVTDADLMAAGLPVG